MRTKKQIEREVNRKITVMNFWEDENFSVFPDFVDNSLPDLPCKVDTMGAPKNQANDDDDAPYFIHAW
jgi:hypothetical protein